MYLFGRACCRKPETEVCIEIRPFAAKIDRFKVRKIAILLLKIEQNGGFFEI